METSKLHGSNAEDVEVTHISKFGIWLLTEGEELFLSHDEFPWFKEAPIGKILKVEQPHPGHFYWPELDVDLDIAIINDADRYPVIFR